MKIEKSYKKFDFLKCCILTSFLIGMVYSVNFFDRCYIIVLYSAYTGLLEFPIYLFAVNRQLQSSPSMFGYFSVIGNYLETQTFTHIKRNKWKD